MHRLGKFLDAEDAKHKLALKREKKEKQKEEKEAKKQKRLQAKERKRQKERRKVKRAKRAALLAEREWYFHKVTFCDGRSAFFKQMKPKHADTEQMIKAMLRKGCARNFITYSVHNRTGCPLPMARHMVDKI
jgi:flagellar biosynthesis GTPase FlhF